MSNATLINAQRRFLAGIWQKVRVRLGPEFPRVPPNSVAELDQLLAQSRARDRAFGVSQVRGVPIVAARATLRVIDSLRDGDEDGLIDSFAPGALATVLDQFIMEEGYQAEARLAREELLQSGTIVGYEFKRPVPLTPDGRWWSTGQFRCTDDRYVNFAVSGRDAPDFHGIFTLAVAVFDARGVGEDHGPFLNDSRNAALTWEFTSRKFEVSIAPPLHVHGRNLAEYRYYHEPTTDPMTIEHCLLAFKDAIRVTPDPIPFWDALATTPA